MQLYPPTNPHIESAWTRSGPVTVSVVSHGHDALLPGLLQGLADTSAGQVAQVVVTHNLPAPSLVVLATWPFAVMQLHNDAPRGFGANHNRAFAQAGTVFFCVMNPDIALVDRALWPQLVDAAGQHGTGCAFPTLRNVDGSVQDNIRAVPTPWRLVQRRLFRMRDNGTDWASGAFWVVPSAVYRALHGFDEGYFMYCEDVDFCLRLQLAKWRLVRVPAHAVHYAQRESGRSLRHLSWHLRSLVRLWLGQPYHRYLQRGARAAGAAP